LQKADLTTRAAAGFVDFLIIIGLARLPDVIGFLAAAGYLLFRDGLFKGQSAGKKLIGIRVALTDKGQTATYRESIIRNIPLTLAFMLFLIPYAGWVLCPMVLGVECLAAIGDDRGMRIGDMLAQTWVIQAVRSEDVDEREPDTQPTSPLSAEEDRDIVTHDG
jgi:uncharacterized RDD family membrane protein YckC